VTGAALTGQTEDHAATTPAMFDKSDKSDKYDKSDEAEKIEEVEISTSGSRPAHPLQI
jgi:hypothetical protein